MLHTLLAACPHHTPPPPRALSLAHSRLLSLTLARQVGGAYELPFSVKRMIELHDVDVVCPIGCLIKGETAHFEYIAEAVTQGLMRVSLDTGVPVLFGVLTVFNADQARARAGIGDGSKHNHGIEWAQTAVEQGVLKKRTS